MRNAIVLAAGKGTRMKSDTPKVLHKILEVPMVELIVTNLKKAGAERIVTVTGYGSSEVEAALNGQCEFALQSPQLGTGHAVMQAHQLEGEEGVTLVVNGDAPTITAETFKALYDALEECDMAVLTVKLEDPSAYGRVLRSSDGSVERIVEYKDCSEQERKVCEINTGIYAFKNKALFEGLGQLTDNNAQHEYYITDLVEIFRKKGLAVKAVVSQNADEVQGVNDNVELARSARWLQQRINEDWMRRGVTIMDPATTYIGPFVEMGHDVILYPGVCLFGHTTLGNDVVVDAHSILRDTEVRDSARIQSGSYSREHL